MAGHTKKVMCNPNINFKNDLNIPIPKKEGE